MWRIVLTHPCKGPMWKSIAVDHGSFFVVSFGFQIIQIFKPATVWLLTAIFGKGICQHLKVWTLWHPRLVMVGWNLDCVWNHHLYKNNKNIKKMIWYSIHTLIGSNLCFGVQNLTSDSQTWSKQNSGGNSQHSKIYVSKRQCRNV